MAQVIRTPVTPHRHNYASQLPIPLGEISSGCTSAKRKATQEDEDEDFVAEETDRAKRVKTDADTGMRVHRRLWPIADVGV